MKILVVGAGAVGGYFGGRLIENGVDVTFLVRERRKQQLENTGLRIESVHGDIEVTPQTIVAGDHAGPFDVILVSTKAYQLEAVLEDLSPFVGDNTMILPLLNGIAHIDILRNKFGANHVIGGLCFVEATLDETGKILQKSAIHDLVFGEFSGDRTDRINVLEETFKGAKAGFRLSENILQDMWHKYIFITTLSGVTTLTRSPIGPIREASGGMSLLRGFIKEVVSIAKRLEAPVSPSVDKETLEKLKQVGYDMKSSMQRDMEKGFPVEADHLQGYFYEKAVRGEMTSPLLETIYTNLKVYEIDHLKK
ncbi:2-dehydropantoate 2-reductase [Bacillus carboniphilus]|uniref:2-dehydropantoate 2-reductase n=1 Tax=Bacillus carboniphilus TaxID=86663 RepID=A0ABN0W9R1_9BACI